MAEGVECQPASTCEEFPWRLGKDILPTKVKLQGKGIRIDTTCSFCGEYPESAKHLFVQCKYSRLAYFSPPPDVDSVKTQLMCTLLWKLWNARNLWHFHQKFKDPHLVYLETWDSVVEFNKQVPAAKRFSLIPAEVCVMGLDRDVLFIQTNVGCFDGGIVSFGCMIKSWDAKVVYVSCNKEVNRYC